jgi:mono/diheme cytochrome c family protein
MVRHIFAAIVVLGFSASVVDAQTRIEKVPIQPTSAADPQQMFDTYCAVCHGKEGKGNGPAASALTKVPADLTRISARNGGTFPKVRVKRFIEGLDGVPAHGTRDMPIWGGLFRALNRDTAELRVEALAQYLDKMQQQ